MLKGPHPSPTPSPSLSPFPSSHPSQEAGPSGENGHAVIGFHAALQALEGPKTPSKTHTDPSSCQGGSGGEEDPAVLVLDDADEAFHHMEQTVNGVRYALGLYLRGLILLGGCPRTGSISLGSGSGPRAWVLMYRTWVWGWAFGYGIGALLILV